MTQHRHITTARGDFDLSGSGRYFEAIGSGTFAHLEACQEVIRQSRVIFDIGANIGATGLYMSRMASNSRVYCFEPYPSSFQALEQNIAGNGAPRSLIPVNLALGSKNGKLRFRESEINASGNGAIPKTGLMSRVNRTIQVEAQTLDRFMRRQRIERVDFIKVDVEGFELDMLRGARRTLRRHKPTVLLEFNHWCLSLYRKTLPEEALDTLFKVFDNIAVYDRRRREFVPIKSDREKLAFLQDNMVKTNVDDLLCSFNTLANPARLGRGKRSDPCGP